MAQRDLENYMTGMGTSDKVDVVNHLEPNLKPPVRAWRSCKSPMPTKGDEAVILCNNKTPHIILPKLASSQNNPQSACIAVLESFDILPRLTDTRSVGKVASEQVRNPANCDAFWDSLRSLNRRGLSHEWSAALSSTFNTLARCGSWFSVWASHCTWWRSDAQGHAETSINLETMFEG